MVYTGHVGPEKGIDALIRTAANVPEARMVIVGGDGSASESEWIESIAREAGARNLVLKPRVPAADVSTYLYAADCLIVPPTDEPLRGGRTVLPLKIFGYLAAGRPILAPRLPDVEEVLTDGETACLVMPQNFRGAAAVLRGLLADSALQAHLARNALATAAEYTWEARARRVLDFIRQAQGLAPEGLRGVTRSLPSTQAANSSRARTTGSSTVTPTDARLRVPSVQPVMCQRGGGVPRPPQQPVPGRRWKT